MESIRVNDYDMAYIGIGEGSPLVCIHGSLGDFRSWAPVMKPLSAGRRLIAPSLRRCFPEHWDGSGGGFEMNRHIDDVIAFVEALGQGPVDLVGHSRGGYLAFRLAQRRPDLIRNLVLAEPGGSLAPDLQPPPASGADPSSAQAAPAAGSPTHMNEVAGRIAAGDLDGGLRMFFDVIGGQGTWDALPAGERQIRLDNAVTLLAQAQDVREPYSRADAASFARPTLLVGGADTPGIFPVIVRALAGHIPGARLEVIADAGHSMVRQQPAAFSAAVLRFLDEQNG